MSQLTTCRNHPADTTRLEFSIPAVDLHHDPEGFTLEVEMPGVRKEGVEITFDDGKLTLTGHRASASISGKAVYSESSAHAYRRVFDLDPSLDVEKIRATVEQGLLTVHLPKAEASKPRKILVS